jgi:hypothetical protein
VLFLGALTKVTFLWGPCDLQQECAFGCTGVLFGASAANGRSSPLPTTMSDYSLGDT